jgi:hypothetical protein
LAAVEQARFLQAFACIGDALSSLALVLAQGFRPTNVEIRGNAALSLECAAAYVRGKPFVRGLDIAIPGAPQ